MEKKHIIPPLLTLREAHLLLHTRASEIEISLDLNKTKEKVQIKENNVIIRGIAFPLEELKIIKENFIYFIEDDMLKRVTLFSDETNLYYKLVPTADWPTITFSSVPMHRSIHLTPKQDTETKIAEIEPIQGIVLDTCCGLGYTSIMAAEKAEHVYVFERDKNVITVAKYNPYSEGLFTKKNITLKTKDINEAILKFKDDFFDRIIHDPPTYSISPELYTEKFYTQLFRVLKSGGILYHYAPAPGKTKLKPTGKEFYLGMIAKLEKTGFKNIVYHESSSGIRAVKP